jgi:hypothetical protein
MLGPRFEVIYHCILTLAHCPENDQRHIEKYGDFSTTYIFLSLIVACHLFLSIYIYIYISLSLSLSLSLFEQHYIGLESRLYFIKNITFKTSSVT